ncbi:hypothetical protein Tcan_05168 [Toxocara canis]|uniref:Uncharacterized protein n=1 Tax=Toxocara canis TaxID=6265 RepID=A0A0B2V3W3_TOXCA|nr:hypothetical protein Tcan_05168 [Toxocara canis]
MEERESGSAASGGEELSGFGEGDDHGFIRRMIESMVDAERDLDVLFFDGPERRDDEDKPEMEENIVQEEIEWRRRADEIGGGVRVGTADVILRDVGREAAIQRGLLAARVFHDDSILMDSSLLRSVRSRGLAFTRSSPQPTPHESRYREDEVGTSLFYCRLFCYV